MLTLKDFFKALNRVRQLDVLTRVIGKLLSHKEWLAGERWMRRARATVCLSSSDNSFHTKNGNDVLQVFVALQDTLHFASNFVVLFANDLWVKNR